MFGLIAVVLFLASGVYYAVNKSPAQALTSFGLAALALAVAPIAGFTS